MSDEVHEYTNGDVTVLWRPGKCQHSGICVQGLRQVFDVKRRPWIDLSQAQSEQIARQVAVCPSGALSLKPK